LQLAQLYIILFPEAVSAGVRINIDTKPMGRARKGSAGAASLERRVPAEVF